MYSPQTAAPFSPSVILVRMAIRAIIFDFGGVLLRTADFTPRIQLAERLGMSRHELEELIFDRDSGNRAQLGQITVHQHWENLRKQLHYSHEEFKDLLGEFFGCDVLDEAMLDYIRKLHQTYKTAMLSNAWDDLRQLIAERWHFEDAFDTMVISSEVGLLKPDPGIFHLTLEKIGVEAHQAAFVDDMRRNVEAAQASGMHGILFRDLNQMRVDLEQLLTNQAS